MCVSSFFPSRMEEEEFATEQQGRGAMCVARAVRVSLDGRAVGTMLSNNGIIDTHTQQQQRTRAENQVCNCCS